MNPSRYIQAVEDGEFYANSGKIIRSQGLIFEAYLPGASLGSVCEIQVTPLSPPVEAEVIGFRDKRVLLMPFEDVHGISNETRVVVKRGSASILVSHAFLGRVIDGSGKPLDGKGPIVIPESGCQERSLYGGAVHPLERELVSESLCLGVRAIDGLLSVGKGQRVGIMAGSGVGKSVLLGMMARNTRADINVIGLIGERGREVREFIERDLGEEALKRSVVIVSTSDKSPLLRMRGAFLATAVAEYFRDLGSDVLLLMDSVTRFCMAQREIGLSLGEPPASKGYTPSVFASLPKLMERAGMAPNKGSITGFYSVLVEGDDLDDPIADAARSILDGHIVLSRKIAQSNRFPAIDVLQSTSRVMRAVVDSEHLAHASKLQEWIASYAQAEDLIQIGAYVKGSNARVDQAIAVRDRIDSFLRQSILERSSWGETIAKMESICRHAENA